MTSPQDNVCLQAVSILDGISDEEVRHKPAVLASQLALQEQQQGVAGAIKTALEGLQWWQDSMTADKSEKAAAQSFLLQQLVHLHLKAGDIAAQHQVLQAVLNITVVIRNRCSQEYDCSNWNADCCSQRFKCCHQKFDCGSQKMDCYHPEA